MRSDNVVTTSVCNTITNEDANTYHPETHHVNGGYISVHPTIMRFCWVIVLYINFMLHLVGKIHLMLNSNNLQIFTSLYTVDCVTETKLCRNLFQSHLSESPGECKLISNMFPDAKHYTEVYKTAGLLNAKVVNA